MLDTKRFDRKACSDPSLKATIALPVNRDRFDGWGPRLR
jgi:hypothetical protein